MVRYKTARTSTSRSIPRHADFPTHLRCPSCTVVSFFESSITRTDMDESEDQVGLDVFMHYILRIGIRFKSKKKRKDASLMNSRDIVQTLREKAPGCVMTDVVQNATAS